ncbi:MAG TPA: AmmeMemoRadiSam system protein B [bacterium]|nr:AmmeMemoRadiSam system protein B [bacterium]HQI48804.1 AmmeMemoRadiSam system protein B [bacterium]HQJ66056.1 AmmeMemoRadiSam system protein B [bacterium]
MSVKWHAAGFLLSVILLPACSALHAQIRKPGVAGQFYPADPSQLRAEIEGFLKQTSAAALPGDLVGLSVSHAGYPYSGATAAAGFKAAAGKEYDLIVVLAPSHQEYFRGGSIYPGEAYDTPLGNLPIDHDAAVQLARKCDLFKLSMIGHGDKEHSLEVQLPFLQVLFKKCRILPLEIGDCSWDECETMGKALAALLKGRKSLMVASTDLYHGYSYSACKESDAATLAAFTRLDPRSLWTGLHNATYQACGGLPVVVMQVALNQRGACGARVLARTNSNDVTGERGGYVVGYAAVAYYLQEKNMNKITYAPLSIAAQKELMRLAKESIKYYLMHGALPESHSTNPELQERRGVFVTITKDGDLRGCIGMHESDKPLYQLVPDRAVAAAFDDPRFMPLQAEELDRIKIKVSVYLSNVYEATLDDFVMGKHGIILMKGGRGATYLPEVPLEAGWRSKEEEMTSLCRKAGLPPDGWKQGAQIYLYETQVFDESVLQ